MDDERSVDELWDDTLNRLKAIVEREKKTQEFIKNSQLSSNLAEEPSLNEREARLDELSEKIRAQLDRIEMRLDDLATKLALR